MNPLFLVNISFLLGNDEGEQEEEQPKMLATQDNCKGYGESFDTVQQLARHSRYCADAKAIREGE